MDIYLQEVNDTGMINLKHRVVSGSAGRLCQWIGLEKLSDLLVLQCACPLEAFVVAPEFLHDLLALTALKALRLENLCWSKVGIFPPDLSVCTDLQGLTLSSYNGSKTRKPTSAVLDFGKYLPESVLKIDLSACPKLLGGSAITSMSSLTNLQNLNLRACWEIEDLTGLCELLSLQLLNVGLTGISELPHDLRKLKHLRVLDVSYCKKLRSIVGIAHATSLQHVNASYCEILTELPSDFSCLQKLQKIDLRNNILICTLPKDYERLAGRSRNGKILELRGCWGLIMPLVKKLRCTKMSHVNCVIPCNTGPMQSWIHATKNVKYGAAYALLKEIISDYEFGGVHWTYRLDDGDEIDFLIQALCEHDNRGAKRTNRLANVVAEVTSDTNARAQWWVAVATAPCTVHLEF
ncbi:hypothetical protein KC19_9G153600 [Ceratodon purpureus]|uniref:Uncharacterized protein n=1 Tax=Ceratodon purpureus TaxID=3225 RepID=A0A8T0GW36_CERPU|nr:hypothetical protein KC19_9G153600 [Ceratodon purpureus]